MPSYDYRCNDCKRRVVLTYKTYADYDTAVPTCPNCKSKNLTRTISRIGLARSESSRFSSIDDDNAIEELANSDPATLGRFMRRMGNEVGQDLGQEFNEVVGRLERGEDPAAIEADLAAPMDSGDDGGSADSGSFVD